MVEDDYIERLKALISPKSKYSEHFRQGYKEMSQSVEEEHLLKADSNALDTARDFLKFASREPKIEDYRKGTMLKLASELMERGIKQKNLEYSFVGLELYNTLNLADRNSVKQRFEKAAKLNPERGYLADAIKIFENAKETSNKSKGLEGKVVSGFFLLSFLAGLFFSSASNLTGNVIGVSQRNSSFIGIILMLFGVL